MAAGIPGKTDAEMITYYSGIVAALVTDNEPVIDKRLQDYLRGVVRQPGVEKTLTAAQRTWLRAHGVEYAFDLNQPAAYVPPV